MAANDPNPTVAGATRPKPTQPDPDAPKAVLSVEDAELFASRIRPSWELIDDVAREDLAADLAAPPAGAKPASDTVIDGVPTFEVGDEAPKAKEKEEEAPFDPKARAVLTKADSEAPKAAEPVKAPPPARGGKTRIGMGNGADEAAPAASSKRAVSAKPATASPAKTAPAEIADDPIEIPVTGAPKGAVVKIAIGAVALLGVVVIGYGLVGGSKKAEDPAPTAVATATAAPTTPQVQTPPPPPEPPAATASASPSATATPTATAKASAAPKEEPKPEPKPEPKKAEPKPEPKKAAASPAPKPPAPPPAKKGGIIRETPF